MEGAAIECLMRHGRCRLGLAFAVIGLSLAVGVSAEQASRKANPSGLNSSTLEEGRAFLGSNELERARMSFEKALARDPASAEGHYLMGMVAERQKDLPAAATSYASAVRYAPTMATAHDRLGFVLGQLGRTDEALRAF